MASVVIFFFICTIYGHIYTFRMKHFMSYSLEEEDSSGNSSSNLLQDWQRQRLLFSSNLKGQGNPRSLHILHWIPNMALPKCFIFCSKDGKCSMRFFLRLEVFHEALPLWSSLFIENAAEVAMSYV